MRYKNVSGRTLDVPRAAVTVASGETFETDYKIDDANFEPVTYRTTS